MRSFWGNKRLVFILALVVVLAGAAGGWYYYKQYLPAQAAPPVETMETAQAYRGDLLITASGSGELIPSEEVELGFSSSGTLVEMLVEVGDRVQAGDVLARLDAAPLERAVIQAEANLTKAQNNLERAKNPYTDLDLIQGRLAVSQAELDLADAQQKLEEARDPYTALDLTQAKLAVAQAEINLANTEEALEKARDPYTELDLTQAKLAVAQAEIDLEDAKQDLEAVLNPDIEAAQAAVRDAEAALESARNQLIVVENDSDNAAKLRTLEAEADWYRRNYWEAQQKFEDGKIDQGKLNQEYSNMLAAEERLTAARAQAESSLANAQNKVTQAEEALQDAQQNLAELQSGPDAVERTRAETRVTQAEYNLTQAQETLAEMEAGSDPLEASRAEAQVAQAEYELSKAQETLAEIEAGPDPLAVSRAETQVAQAEYNLATAQEMLTEIEAGPDPDEVELAEADLISAQASLEEAQANLEAATLTAPFGATVISVGASAGDSVSSNTVVVALANLETPQILFWVEETDLASVAPGNAVNSIFEALPDYVFPGEILKVDPSLVRVDNTWAIQSRASVDLSAHPVNLLSGMNAEVEIVAGEARNAVLVPIQALREIAPDQYAVFVVRPNGELEMRMVEVGLKDYVNAEILSGLETGESVSVGAVESSDTSTDSSSGDEQPAPGMMRFFGGG